jgi:hypothetical protein
MGQCGAPRVPGASSCPASNGEARGVQHAPLTKHHAMLSTEVSFDSIRHFGKNSGVSHRIV